MKNVTSQRIEAVTPATLIVGIDAAKDVHWARFTDYRGIDLMKPCKVNNTILGFESLVQKVENLKKKRGCDKVIIGCEPSGHYWRALGWFLKLHESKPILVGVNPYHTKQTKELDDNSQTKSDKKDALVIAHLIRDGRYFDMYLPEAEYAELRILNGERKRLMKQVSRANNTLVAVLDEFFPELAEVWKDVTCPTSREILKRFAFPREILAASREDLLDVVREASKGKEGKKLSDEMLEAAQSSVGVKEGLKSAKSRLLRLIEELNFYEERVEEIEKELDAEMDGLELGEILTSMDGVGTIISAAFIGEVGDVGRFESWKQVRKLAGLNLVEQSSGKHIGKTKVSKRGRPYLRHMLFMAGKNCCRNNEEMRQHYHYLRRRRENPLGGYAAFVAVGLKVMRILFYMAKRKEKYDPEKALGDVRKAQIASLAA
jgi:transposase